MVGERQGGLLEFLRARYQVIDAVRAVEERVLGVAVEVDEGHTVQYAGCWRDDSAAERRRYCFVLTMIAASGVLLSRTTVATRFESAYSIDITLAALRERSWSMPPRRTPSR